MQYPKVTIVTPSLNQVKYIQATIDSVKRQDYPYIEHIIQDGGSTDGTHELLVSCPGLTIFKEPDAGQADAINRGMERSTGLICTWLNSDDTLMPTAVSAAVERFQLYPDLGLLYGNAWFVDEDDHLLFATDAYPFDLELMVTSCKNPICQPASFFSRAAWGAVGGLDANLSYFLDWDLWLRIGEQFPVLQIRDTLATYRLHPESKTGRADYPAHELRDIYAKLGDKLGADTPAARASLYERMADYQQASGHSFQAWLSRRRAWLTSGIFTT